MKMRMGLVATIVGFSFLSLAPLAVNAGNLDEPIIQILPAPIVDWSGIYVGGYLTFGDGSYLQQDDITGVGVDVDVDGAGLGLRYGQNWQNAAAVFGFDVSLQSGIDGIKVQGSNGPVWGCNTGHCNVSIEALMTVRGRYGMVFGDGKTMAYGALGLAAGAIEGGIAASNQQGSSTALGYTAGFGLERMFTDGISMFGEVNYVDLGDIDFGTGGGPGGSGTFYGAGDFTKVLVGVNYRF
jgi:outer membrane immunogenic protein